MASLVAMLGFLIIPARRRRAKAEMQEKLTALPKNLASALRAEFTRATEASSDSNSTMSVCASARPVSNGVN